MVAKALMKRKTDHQKNKMVYKIKRIKRKEDDKEVEDDEKKKNEEDERKLWKIIPF